MKKIIPALVLAALSVAGCATSKTVVGQDGRTMHKISCDGMAQGIEACYEKAGEICGASGYDVVNQDGSSTPLAVAAGGSFTMVSAVYRSVLVRCKA